MKRLLNWQHVFALLLIIAASPGCKKFLDEKTDQKLVVPHTLKDAQALLDFYESLSASHGYYPNLGDDNYYLKETYFNGLSANLRNAITWQADVNTDLEWSKFYTMVVTANVALEILEKNERSPQNEASWNNIKGSAHFYRAWAFFQLLQYFTEPYDAATVAGKPGIPLRLSSNTSVVSTRAPLAQSWTQVLEDYKTACRYLPVIPAFPTRPGRPAAFEGLALAFLHMDNWANAGLYADSALQLNSQLLDYNSLNPAAVNPFSMFNKEVTFPAYAYSTSVLSVNNHIIDSTLFNSYHANDLRRSLFFKSNGINTVGFRGSYHGNTTSSALFCGLTTAESFLIKAEAHARLGLKDSAMADLNRLLVSRWKSGLFVPLAAATREAALKIILEERRKEMVMRGSRWFDLRRLNKEAAFAVTLKRKLGANIFELPPQSKRYTFYIPNQVIFITGMQQNER